MAHIDVHSRPVRGPTAQRLWPAGIALVLALAAPAHHRFLAPGLRGTRTAISFPHGGWGIMSPSLRAWPPCFGSPPPGRDATQRCRHRLAPVPRHAHPRAMPAPAAGRDSSTPAADRRTVLRPPELRNAGTRLAGVAGEAPSTGPSRHQLPCHGSSRRPG
jgi:hypothetical protein